MSRFSSAVIGLGQIGQGYDLESTGDNLVLTHASGFFYHPAFELTAAVDPIEEKRKCFEKKYEKPAYPTIEALYNSHALDVVAISVPTALHAESFGQCINKSLKAVICEKPIANNVAEAQAMLAKATQANCSVLVNYIRRFEPGVLRLKQEIKNGSIGSIFKGTVWYSKGILNNGSHYLDLLRFLLGEVTAIEVIEKGRVAVGADPEPDVRISFGDTSVYFLAGREECFSVLELELIGTAGKINYSAGGNEISMQRTMSDALYPGYTILNPEKELIISDIKRYQWHVLEHLAAHLQKGSALNSDGESALATLRQIEAIITLLEKPNG